VEAFLNTQSLTALFVLTVLEIVLGIDNIIFLTIVTAGLPEQKQPFARKLGLSLALIGRIVMVLGISWILRLDTDLFTIFGHSFSLQDVILLGGGIFLVYKAVTEIYKTTELKEEDPTAATAVKDSMASVVFQVVVVDMIFAIDSVLTAVGLTQQIGLIIIAMTIAIGVMMFFAEPLSKFIHEHPSVKMLALSFLVLVGVLLISDGFGEEINRSYVYFAILFSIGVEALNFRRQANLERKLAESARADA